MIMMPRLQAEGALESVRIAQIGGGQFEPNSKGAKAAQEKLEEWQAAVEGRNSTESTKQRTKDERRKTQAMLFDIGVKKVTKETPDGQD